MCEKQRRARHEKQARAPRSSWLDKKTVARFTLKSGDRRPSTHAMPKSELVPYGAGHDLRRRPNADDRADRLPIRLGRWRCVGGERGGFFFVVDERTNERKGTPRAPP
jgi:hypothetical protein